MAAPVGATIRGYGRCPKYSEIFPVDPTDPFDVGRPISDRLQTDVDKAMPRQYGHFCLGPRIRESALVWMRGRSAVE